MDVCRNPRWGVATTPGRRPRVVHEAAVRAGLRVEAAEPQQRGQTGWRGSTPRQRRPRHVEVAIALRHAQARMAMEAGVGAPEVEARPPPHQSPGTQRTSTSAPAVS